MNAKSKDYLLKTITAIVLMGFGAWAVHVGGKANTIIGVIGFIIGFVIMTILYGQKWVRWGTDIFR